MGGQADMADLARSLGLLQCFQSAAGRRHLLQLLRSGIVDLVNIDIVGAQIAKAGFNIRSHGFPGAGHALGGDDKILPDALQGIA